MLKNITLSADEQLIKKARKKAQADHTTLNAEFRQWLRQYLRKNIKSNDFYCFKKQLNYVDCGGKFSRDELNER